MKIFDWLRRSPKVEAPTPEKRTNLKPVPKWTHGGKKGKTVYCPRCLQSTHVGHFAWSTLVCPKCREATGKYKWLIETKVEGK